MCNAAFSLEIFSDYEEEETEKNFDIADEGDDDECSSRKRARESEESK